MNTLKAKAYMGSNMTRTTIMALALAATAVTAAPALAGGTVEPVVMAPVAVPAPAPVADWTGFYAGVQLDFINGTDRGFGNDADFDGHLIGIFGGYRYDFGTIVAGVELDYMTGEGDFDVVGGPTVDIDYDALHRIGVEVGYDAGPALIYATGGYASLELTIPGFSSDPEDGVFYGIGMDYRISDTWTVGAELLRHDFLDFAIDTNDLRATTLGLNVAFTF